jgi:hypothetical protein
MMCLLRNMLSGLKMSQHHDSADDDTESEVWEEFDEVQSMISYPLRSLQQDLSNLGSLPEAIRSAHAATMDIHHGRRFSFSIHHPPPAWSAEEQEDAGIFSATQREYRAEQQTAVWSSSSSSSSSSSGRAVVTTPPSTESQMAPHGVEARKRKLEDVEGRLTESAKRTTVPKSPQPNKSRYTENAYGNGLQEFDVQLYTTSFYVLRNAQTAGPEQDAWLNLAYGEPPVSMIELASRLSDNMAQWDGAGVRTRYDEFYFCDDMPDHVSLATNLLIDRDPEMRRISSRESFRVSAPIVMREPMARGRAIPVPYIEPVGMLLHLGYSLAAAQPLRVDLSHTSMYEVYRILVARHSRAFGPSIGAVEAHYLLESDKFGNSLQRKRELKPPELLKLPRSLSALEYLTPNMASSFVLRNLSFVVIYNVIDATNPMSDYVRTLSRPYGSGRASVALPHATAAGPRPTPLLLRMDGSALPPPSMRIRRFAMVDGLSHKGYITPEALSESAEQNRAALRLDRTSRAITLDVTSRVVDDDLSRVMWSITGADVAEWRRERVLDPTFRLPLSAVEFERQYSTDMPPFVGERTHRLLDPKWQYGRENEERRKRTFVSSSCAMFVVDIRQEQLRSFVLQTLIPDPRTVVVFDVEKKRPLGVIFQAYENALAAGAGLTWEEYRGRVKDKYGDDFRVTVPRYRGLFGNRLDDFHTCNTLRNLVTENDGDGESMMQFLLRSELSDETLPPTVLHMLRAMALGTYNVVFGYHWFILRPVEDV